MKVKGQSEKAGLQLHIQKTKIMASNLITSWQMYGETMEIVPDFLFWGSKITADGDCSHEIKRCLLLRRKAMTNLDRVLKSRDIILPTMVHLVKVMFFPVVMHGYESWTIKKAEHWSIDGFKLWCWKLLRVPWTARKLETSRKLESPLDSKETLESPLDSKKIKPANPKEINPKYSWGGHMLKLQ